MINVDATCCLLQGTHHTDETIVNSLCKKIKTTHKNRSRSNDYKTGQREKQRGPIKYEAPREKLLV